MAVRLPSVSTDCRKRPFCAKIRVMNIIPGLTIGRWYVISGPHREVRKTAKCTNYFDVFECRCECGTVKRVRKHKLLRNSRSCGCLKLQNFTEQATKHGQTKRNKRTRLYRIWSGMTERCTNPKHYQFGNYGGRGVTVCDEWRSFAAFADWAAANGYSDNLQIDRQNNVLGYKPDNCAWVSRAINARNKRSNYNVSAYGETKCTTDWALDPRCGVSPATIKHRIEKLGLTPEAAISNPRSSKKSSPRFAGHHSKL